MYTKYLLFLSDEGPMLETLVNTIRICSTLTFLYFDLYTKILNCLSRSDVETLVHAFITIKLDNCNSLLFGLPRYHIDRLQRIQSSAARLITGSRKDEHITPILKQLHWLPIHERI